MPRAVWSGSIAFGLVNVPVRMYSAIEEHDLHFHPVHEPDGSRIGYQKVCKAEEPQAPTDLMAALRASVEAARGHRGSARDGELERLSKEELYELAKRADVPGRSDMSKRELLEALKAA